MDSINGKLELVGVVAVVLSLLFVAFEIRQNTNTAAAQAVFELNEAGRQTQFLQVTDSNLVALLIQAENDLDALTVEQRYRYRIWVFSFQNLYESAWNHHHRGVINDQDMEGWKTDYCNKMSIESYRKVAQSITANASQFREDAAQWCQ